MKTLAFISYSRKDKSVAHWLHSKLEKYPYPKVSISIENRLRTKNIYVLYL